CVVCLLPLLDFTRLLTGSGCFHPPAPAPRARRKARCRDSSAGGTPVRHAAAAGSARIRLESTEIQVDICGYVASISSCIHEHTPYTYRTHTITQCTHVLLRYSGEQATNNVMD